MGGESGEGEEGGRMGVLCLRERGRDGARWYTYGQSGRLGYV